MEFTIYGKPMGKQRPRFQRVGNFTKTYTPKETINFETMVKMECIRQCEDELQADFDGCINLEVTAFFPIPKSTSKKKRLEWEQEQTYYTKKPDWDNIGKIITDALNSVAYSDDKCIVNANVRKYYGKVPRTEVRIDYDD